MSERICSHLRSNVIGYAALFVALTGTAYAAQTAPKNSVVSKSIKNGQVMTADVADGSIGVADVDTGSIQARVRGLCGAGQAVARINQDGGVSCVATGGGALSGPAGGDLTGTYPNPTIAGNAVTSAKIANGSVGNADLAPDAVDSSKVLDGTLQTGDLAPDAVDSSKVLDGTLLAGDLSSAPPFGSGGFNGDEKIQDGSIIGFFDIAPNTVSEGQIADSVGSSGAGTDTSCFDDTSTGEVCASTTFTLADPGKVLLNATGQWRTFATPPDSMSCVLQADGANVGLAQSFGENGSNHTGTQANGTMALTGLTGTLSAGSHTFQTFCTQTDADIDLLNNQITGARVDG